MGPPPLYCLGTGWWYSDPSVFVSLVVSTVADQFFFVPLRVSVLFLHAFSTVFVISFSLAFLSFMCFLLLTLPAIPCFFLSCFFVSVFKPIFFIQKDLDLYGPNNVDQIKRVLGSICLCLPKSFCRRTVFYQRTVFCCRSVFCYRLLSLTFLSLDLSCSSVFLVGLAFHWAFFLMVRIQKWASTLILSFIFPITKSFKHYLWSFIQNIVTILPYYVSIAITFLLQYLLPWARDQDLC